MQKLGCLERVIRPFSTKYSDRMATPEPTVLFRREFLSSAVVRTRFRISLHQWCGEWAQKIFRRSSTDCQQTTESLVPVRLTDYCAGRRNALLLRRITNTELSNEGIFIVCPARGGRFVRRWLRARFVEAERRGRGTGYRGLLLDRLDGAQGTLRVVRQHADRVDLSERSEILCDRYELL